MVDGGSDEDEDQTGGIFTQTAGKNMTQTRKKKATFINTKSSKNQEEDPGKAKRAYDFPDNDPIYQYH